MKTLSRRYAVTLVMLCALLILGAQQAAFVHLLSHLAPTAEAAAQPQEGGSHGKVPDRVCATCAAFASLDAAPLILALPLAVMPAHNPAAQYAVSALLASHSGQYLARAPPILL